MRILSRTNVGSHMWGMEREDSDIDLFEIYLADTRDILLQGRQVSYCRKVPGSPDMDVAGHELGKTLTMILTGNVNFVWGVFSPIILKSSREFEELKEIAVKNKSQSIYHSINGMSLHNILHLKKDGLTEKKARTILRTIDFGTRYLETGEICLRKNDEELPGDYTRVVGLVNERLSELTEARNHSPLPEYPQYIVEAHDWLVKTRLENVVI